MDKTYVLAALSQIGLLMAEGDNAIARSYLDILIKDVENGSFCDGTHEPQTTFHQDYKALMEEEASISARLNK